LPLMLRIRWPVRPGIPWGQGIVKTGASVRPGAASRLLDGGQATRGGVRFCGGRQRGIPKPCARPQPCWARSDQAGHPLMGRACWAYCRVLAVLGWSGARRIRRIMNAPIPGTGLYLCSANSLSSAQEDPWFGPGSDRKENKDEASGSGVCFNDRGGNAGWGCRNFAGSEFQVPWRSRSHGQTNYQRAKCRCFDVPVSHHLASDVLKT